MILRISTYTLKPGENVIVAPEINKGHKSPGGGIYIENPYTKEQQGKAPVVTIEGGTNYPVFRKGENVEQFKAELIEYKNKLDKDNTLLDIFDIDGSKMLITGRTIPAYDAYINENVNPEDVIEFWDNVMDDTLIFNGMDKSSKKHDPKSHKTHMRLSTPVPGASMHTNDTYIGMYKGSHIEKYSLNPEKLGAWGFGAIAHEIAHTMETRYLFAEISTDIVHMYLSEKYYGKIGKNFNYEGFVYPNVASNERTHIFSSTKDWYGNSGSVFWQLQTYDENYWAKYSKTHRENNNFTCNGVIEQMKLNDMVKSSSEALNLNLFEHFNRHGFYATTEVGKELEKYPKLTDKTWYLNNSSYKYNGESLNEKDVPVLNENINMNILNHVELNFDSKIPKEKLLGYEIIRNGEVIGFTSTNKFVDKKIKNIDKKYEYKIVAYGHDLSVSGESNTVSIGENKDFIDSKTTNLLNYPPKSYKQSYKEPVRNKTLSGDKLSLTNENKEEVIYNDGIGAYANSEIIYDISDKDYEKFTAYVGVNRAQLNTKASVEFKVLVDGKEKYNSGLMKANDVQKFVEVNIANAKELKLVITDGGDKNDFDHANWADPKLHYSEDKVVEGELAKIVTIPDKQLRESIKSELGIKNDKNITKAEMLKLVNLTDNSSNVRDLTGLEYASNLENLNLDFNEIQDISVVQKLKKLTNFSSEYNSYMGESQYFNNNGNIIIYEPIIDADGQEIIPSEIVISPGKDPKSLDVNEVYKNGNIVIDSDLVKKNALIEIIYESKNNKYSICKEIFADGTLDYKENTAPKILGTNNVTIKEKEEFDPLSNVRVKDREDGNLIQSVKIDGNVDTQVPGTYELQYSVTDSKGLETISKRVVTVEPSLDKIISIEDEVLEMEIKSTLNIDNRDITLGDMHNLTSLECDSWSVTSLKGLEYAVNLESLNIDNNEVSDISPIKDLKKLKNFSGIENNRLNPANSVLFENDKFIVENVVIDLDGERLLPKEVILSQNKIPKKLDLNEVLVGNKVVIDSSLIERVGSLEIIYESKHNNYQLYALSLLSSK